MLGLAFGVSVPGLHAGHLATIRPVYRGFLLVLLAVLRLVIIGDYLAELSRAFTQGTGEFRDTFSPEEQEDYGQKEL